MPRAHRSKGMTLIEAVFGIALLSLAFWGLFGAFQLSVQLVSTTKAKAGALALANEQVEFLRSISYSSVGTVGGIPPGVVPQTETLTLNQTTYTRRTLVQYVDSPDDGIGVLDANGIVADYKVAKVELTWDIRGSERSFSLVTNIVPKGIESSVAGGTLVIKVIDAYGNPLSGASVRVFNDALTPTIDVSTFSNSSGIVNFPGAPASSDYEVVVTKSGYSTAQTYDATVSLPNPNPGHISVAVDTTTNATFAIDRVSSNAIRTLKPIQLSSWTDSLSDGTNIAQQVNTSIAAGALTLSTSEGLYISPGTARTIAIAPSYLFRWRELSWNDTEPNSTQIRYRVYYESSPGVFDRIPDAILSGNSGGFTTSPVDVSVIPAATYPTLYLQAELDTGDTSVTPALLDWQLSYEEGPLPLPNIAFNVQGGKSIGSDAGALPVYKYDEDHETDASGTVTLNNLEWDIYTISVDGATEGWDPSDFCPSQPYALSPATSAATDIYFVPHTNHSLLVAVADAQGAVVSGANVELELASPSYSETQSTSSCGQVFFSGLTAAGTYTLTVSKTGYQTVILSNVNISEQTQTAVVINAN